MNISTGAITISEAEEPSPDKGYGACGHGGCGCDGYVSDSTHSGYCVCGHTASEHAFKK